MTMNIQRSARFVVAPNVCSIVDRNGTAILSIDRGKFYSLIETASLVWERLRASKQGATVAEIVDYLEKSGDCSAEGERLPDSSISQNVEALLVDLQRHGVIRASDERPLAETRSLFAETRSRNEWWLRAISWVIRPTGRLCERLGIETLAALFYFGLFELIGRTVGYRARRHVIKEWPVRGGHSSNDLATHTREARDREDEQHLITALRAAVDRASIVVPKESRCLQRASVLTCLLRDRGLPAEMVIGAHKLPFGAHSWVEIGNTVVNDQKTVQTYYQVLDRY